MKKSDDQDRDRQAAPKGAKPKLEDLITKIDFQYEEDLSDFESYLFSAQDITMRYNEDGGIMLNASMSFQHQIYSMYVNIVAPIEISTMTILLGENRLTDEARKTYRKSLRQQALMHNFILNDALFAAKYYPLEEKLVELYYDLNKRYFEAD